MELNLLEHTDPTNAPGPQIFDELASEFRERQEYPLVFEARLMKKRLELGLPLASPFSLADLPEAAQKEYEKATIEAARETGELFLSSGDLGRAWPYYRALGDPAPVREALTRYAGGEDLDRVLEIAYQERVAPLRGLELILEHWGICRAITLFDQYPDPDTREQGLALLVNQLYGEVRGNLRYAIGKRGDPQPPPEASLLDLIEGRDWLFEGNSYYVDTSHVCSILRQTLDSEDRETQCKGLELAEYGCRLAPMFHFRGDPPFEETFPDHRVYLRALLGLETEEGIAHFRRKVREHHPEDFGMSAQVLVDLLVRLGRPKEALAEARQYLSDFERHQLRCPTVLELCEMAQDYPQMAEFAKEKGDKLALAAAEILGGQLRMSTTTK